MTKETPDSILSALEEEVTEDGRILLARLTALSPRLVVVPTKTFQAGLDALGPCVYARSGRVVSAFRSKVAHALDTWESKYGPLNDEQFAYADEVLAWAIKAGAAWAGAQQLPYSAPGVFSFIEDTINHERTDAGFKRRASAKIDVASEVAEVLRRPVEDPATGNWHADQ